MSRVEIWPGRESPLGATPDAQGTNFAVYSKNAEAVDLCLFDEDGAEIRLPLQETHHVWHGYVPGVGPGARYGFRVDGPFEPHRGLRFNPSKLLVDPYARALDGAFVLDDAVFGYPRGRDDTIQDHRDSAPFVPKSVVVVDDFDWSGDRRPDVPWSDTVIYEVHVRGFTILHPDVPAPMRGTFAGLAHPAVVDYLLSLGVTAVELMPVHHFVSEPAVLRRGLTNYWGYNTLGYFAPHAGYSSRGSRGQQVREFKEMVKTLHAAGIEVILDVVYNHTCEGDERGPTLAFRGLDNTTYYRLRDGGRHYVNHTGTGNMLDLRNFTALKLVMDSLRYWVTEMHVDGFRFDLATSLVRSEDGVDMAAAFLAAVHQDPVLSTVKLIAEPWDLGPHGYQVGRFPPPWAEWNDRFRDTIRDFWLRGSAGVRELAYRLSGSSDLYQDGGRRPYASINYAASHDGFTVHDLVTYDRRHNEANGEGNRDGAPESHNWNCGHEGETDDPVVNRIRARAVRNLLATTLLSTGVPMICHGDELGRTQRGNNNAYCQDNEISWVDWEHADRDLLGFVRDVIKVRRSHPVFRQPFFFTGSAPAPDDLKDLAWFGIDGKELSQADWFDTQIRTLGMYLSGGALRVRDLRGRPVHDDSFFLVLHAGLEPVDFVLPGPPWAESYSCVVDSTGEFVAEAAAGSLVTIPALAFLVLKVRRD
ncbi:MAG: glycogen debranching protein GlgX [Acidothermus sp.]|nr:glycogen debranching protein GlgX [Acidothermus sp.]MCL6537259.1 glycogen debranching protein GlgX [Acidothermus sp.]